MGLLLLSAPYLWALCAYPHGLAAQTVDLCRLASGGVHQGGSIHETVMNNDFSARVYFALLKDPQLGLLCSVLFDEVAT